MTENHFDQCRSKTATAEVGQKLLLSKSPKNRPTEVGKKSSQSMLAKIVFAKSTKNCPNLSQTKIVLAKIVRFLGYLDQMPGWSPI